MRDSGRGAGARPSRTGAPVGRAGRGGGRRASPGGTAGSGGGAVEARPAGGDGAGVLVEAAIFDLDAVLTDAAALHADAWRRLFDEVLDARPGIAPFTQEDYVRYVEGVRPAGAVVAVLASRGIAIPAGEEGDPPDRDTAAGLARREDVHYARLLRERGPASLPSSLAMVRALRSAGVGTAAVSAGRHSGEVLTAMGAAQLFDVRVDRTAAGDAGTPYSLDRWALLEAARRLGIDPPRAAVVVGAAAGARAARECGFGVVAGLDRVGQPEVLEEAGAGLVVADLSELEVVPAGPGRARLARALAAPLPAPGGEAAPADDQGPNGAAWLWSFDGYDPGAEGQREALCTLGNGFFATRGCGAEARQDEVHYPGTYAAGCYNRVTTLLDGSGLDNESLVNLPNWLDLRLRVEDGDWFEPDRASMSVYRRELDVRRGVLSREVRFEDAAGRTTRLLERRIVSMADPHLAALELQVTAENWSGRLTVRAGIDGRVVNRGVRADRGFAGDHLALAATSAASREVVELAVDTTQSHVRVTIAARLRAVARGVTAGDDRRALEEPGYIGQELSLDLAAGGTVVVEKVAALYTSRDHATSEPREAAVAAVQRAPGFAGLLAEHVAAWAVMWSRFRLRVENGTVNHVLRLHAFHLVQTLSRHTMELDVGVPARGLHGEGYRGHVFWDDVLVLPFLTFRLPELVRELLRYRYRRLDAARRAAAAIGCAGALFPWQSGSDGREETPTRLFNSLSGRWMVDNSRLQRHVNLAIAYDVWHYYEVTEDLEFLAAHGAEMLVEIARLFSGLATFDAARGRYVIRGVMGPDEFHDAYPGAERPGLDDNAYTNVMVVWLMRRTADALAALHGYHRDELVARLDVTQGELDRWADMAVRMYVPFHADGVISQFEGYERLAELDWNAYRRRYPDIGRLDLILEAEGDTCNRYRAAKQADVLMLLYLLSAEELRDILTGLGYALPPEAIRRTVDHYLTRTSHGSTLSQIVDAWILARSDRGRSWSYFLGALGADVANAQGSTAEGIHLAAMAGSLDVIQRCYMGLEARAGTLWLNPQFPPELGSLGLDVRYKGQWITFQVTPGHMRIVSLPCAARRVRISVRGRVITVHPGDIHEVEIPDRRRRRAVGG